MPKKKSKKQTLFKRLLPAKRLAGIIVVLLVAAVGTYIVMSSNAAVRDCDDDDDDDCSQVETPAAVLNPGLTRSCGLDVALLVDMSGSMSGDKLRNAKEAMKMFVTALRNTQTQFAIGKIDTPEQLYGGGAAFSQDTNTVLGRINQLGGSGSSTLGDLTRVTALDPRGDRPNLIIVLSDFEISYEQSNASTVKQAGNRILALVYGGASRWGGGRDVGAATSYVAGSNVDTGSIFTSDVINADPNTIGGLFETFAAQLCNVGPAAGIAPGPGAGSTGKGKGTGGGSSSTAKTQAPNPQPIPTGGSEGDTKQPQVEPSPFIDGKTFKPGSDRDDQVFGSATVGGQKIFKLWIYIAVLVMLVGGFAAWRFWWRPRHQTLTHRK